MKPQNIFVVGTDTGVGKTVLSLLLMQFYFSKAYTPFYIKPFQTGCKDPFDTNSDSKFIYKHVLPLNKKNPADSVVYCFKNPKAPFFAARDEMVEIRLKKMQDMIQAKNVQHHPLIIEGAGGLFVPVKKKVMLIDIIAKTGAKPVIAARAGLGTINHTLLSIEALHRRNVPQPGIVFIDSGNIPVPDEMIAENMEAVKDASGIQVAGVIRRISDFSKPEKATIEVISKLC